MNQLLGKCRLDMRLGLIPGSILHIYGDQVELAFTSGLAVQTLMACG